MSIVEPDGPPSWFLDAYETGESTKCRWVGVIGLIAWGWRGGKIGRPCLVFTVLVASATATPDWSKGQLRAHHSIAERWEFERQKMTFKISQLKISQNGIDFRRIFWRMFWFWSSVCFLSWSIGVKARAKRGCFLFMGRLSIFWIRFNAKMYVQKICYANFVNSSPFRADFESKCTCSFRRNHQLKFQN